MGCYSGVVNKNKVVASTFSAASYIFPVAASAGHTVVVLTVSSATAVASIASHVTATSTATYAPVSVANCLSC